MCIIIHKPKDKTVDLDALKRCWDRNDHGAGFMFANDNKVWGNKGYMTFEALLAGLHGAGFYRKGKLTGKHAVTIHFRLASHGKIQPSNCHPFPVTDELDVLKARFWEADCGVAHNGVIPIERDNKNISDTMTYIMARMSMVYDQMDNDEVYNLVAEETTGSRLFILKADGSHILFGGWTEEDGILYSNEGFRVPQRKPQSNVVAFPSYQTYLNQDLDWKETKTKRPPAPPGMKWVTAK